MRRIWKRSGQSTHPLSNRSKTKRLPSSKDASGKRLTQALYPYADIIAAQPGNPGPDGFIFVQPFGLIPFIIVDFWAYLTVTIRMWHLQSEAFCIPSQHSHHSDGGKILLYLRDEECSYIENSVRGLRLEAWGNALKASFSGTMIPWHRLEKQPLRVQTPRWMSPWNPWYIQRLQDRLPDLPQRWGLCSQALQGQVLPHCITGGSSQDHRYGWNGKTVNNARDV